MQEADTRALRDGLAVDDQEPYWIYAAQNDNSHIAIPSRTDDRSIGWMHYLPLPVGEGGQTAVKPDGSVVYAADRARMFRFDRETGQTPDISVWPEVEFGTAVEDVKYRWSCNQQADRVEPSSTLSNGAEACGE